MLRRALILAILGLVLNAFHHRAEAAGDKPAPLTLKLSGNVSRAESDVVVRMRVERDERARELLIEWVGADLSGGSHVITLDGARAAISHQYAIKRLAEGSYVVRATLRFNDGTEARKQATLIMVGAGTPTAAGGIIRGAMQQ